VISPEVLARWPHWQSDDGGVVLVNADCREVLPVMEPGSADAVVTDPPYGVDFRAAAWDKDIPSWFDITRRVCTTVVFTTAPTTLWDYPQPDWVLCWLRDAAHSRTAQGGFCNWTPIPLYGARKFPVDVFKSHGMVDGQLHKAIEHPCPKPVKLLLWLTTNVSKPGGLVLDPFMGSGTTGVACIRLGRRFIGIELDPGYYEIAKKRIQAELAARDGKGPLFEASTKLWEPTP